MRLHDVYQDPTISTLEEKFSLIRKSSTEFVGKYPLEAFHEDARGTYGGEFVAQSLVAAMDSVSDKEFQPHSLHSYFLKAGRRESPMRYEVKVTSEGRNFCNRLVQCYQQHTGELCFILMVSFARNNLICKRKSDFAALSQVDQEHPRAKVPYEFLRQPHFTFDKYIHHIHSLPHEEHINSNIVHAVPPETWKVANDESLELARKEFGVFFKVNDNMELMNDRVKGRLIALVFASDSFFLGTLVRAMGLSLDDPVSRRFFRVSLDHLVFFHDIDFDPTKWMFFDYRFARMSNDRVLVIVLIFSHDRRLVATVTQEAIAYVPLGIAKKGKGGSYKL